MAPTSDAAPLLRLDGFEGPLDLLLTLARGQRLDLSRISILSLVEQYLAVVGDAARLELAADWLVMAAWLAWLKSRLLLPQDSEAAQEAEDSAELLAAQLRDLQRMRAAAGWLAARPALGQDVFARGLPEPPSAVAVHWRLELDLPGLLRSYTTALRRGTRGPRYRPVPVTLWSVQQALARLGALLGSMPDWNALERFLPEHRCTPRQRRAALASTLLAGLELARGGVVTLRQAAAFGPILLRPAASRSGGDGG